MIERVACFASRAPHRLERRVGVTAAMATVALLMALPAHAQRLPSLARVPLTHWAMPFLEHLVDKGAVSDPSPLMRPWRVGEIAAALRDADTTTLTGAERRTRHLVLSEFASDSAQAWFLGGIGGGIVASSHHRRAQFDFRPAGDDRFTPDVRGMLAIAFGPGVLVADGRYVEDLENDPDYAGVPGRLQAKSDAVYGLYDSKYLDVELGSLSRNWGPSGFPGLLVSDWPLNYDHLFVDVGPRRLHLSMLVTELDDAPDITAVIVKRYFIAHRLAAQPFRWLDLALWQGTVFSGPGRNLELGFLNPLQVSHVSRNQRGVESNLLLGADGRMRLGRFLLSGSLFGDDYDVRNEEPPSFALTATVATAVGPVSAWLGYTLVSNLAYRTNDPADVLITSQDPTRGKAGTGLARNFSDYDQLALRVSMLPMPALVVTPELMLIRQGEGDLRSPFPPASEYPNTPVLFAGTVERTWRAAIAVTFRPLPALLVRLNGGVHRVQNAAHVAGASRTDAVGTVEVRYTLQFGGALEGRD